MKILGPINRGGFGRVEKVETTPGCILARKVFDPQPSVLGADPVVARAKFVKRFVREVRVQSSLGGDFVLPVHGFDLISTPPWFTMPLADRSLQDEISRSRDDAKQALPDVLNALEEMHKLGLVHRDLKPANVLFHEGKWKLSDFGLVLPAPGTTTTLTSTSSAWGTSEYAAPEQVNDFGNVTLAADIYAFGCILHDIFNGSPRIPFQRQTCPGSIGPIIEKCTELDPRRRFKSVGALRSVLLTALSAAPIPSTATGAAWLARIADIATWTADDLEQFARFITSDKNISERDSLCRALDEETLKAMQCIDAIAWRPVADCYCEWATGSFAWNYCDVIIGRLVAIFEVGEVETIASAIMAAARLACSHNRWFVMRQVLAMAGSTLADEVAHRVAIEIVVQDAHRDFTQSAAAVSEPIDRYHPRIADVLRKNPTT